MIRFQRTDSKQSLAAPATLNACRELLREGVVQFWRPSSGAVQGSSGSLVALYGCVAIMATALPHPERD